MPRLRPRVAGRPTVLGAIDAALDEALAELAHSAQRAVERDAGGIIASADIVGAEADPALSRARRVGSALSASHDPQAKARSSQR
jgi:hypothetical protein